MRRGNGRHNENKTNKTNKTNKETRYKYSSNVQTSMEEVSELVQQEYDCRGLVEEELDDNDIEHVEVSPQPRQSVGVRFASQIETEEATPHKRRRTNVTVTAGRQDAARGVKLTSGDVQTSKPTSLPRLSGLLLHIEKKSKCWLVKILTGDLKDDERVSTSLGCGNWFDLQNNVCYSPFVVNARPVATKDDQSKADRQYDFPPEKTNVFYNGMPGVEIHPNTIVTLLCASGKDDGTKKGLYTNIPKYSKVSVHGVCSAFSREVGLSLLKDGLIRQNKFRLIESSSLAFRLDPESDEVDSAENGNKSMEREKYIISFDKIKVAPLDSPEKNIQQLEESGAMDFPPRFEDVLKFKNGKVLLVDCAMFGNDYNMETIDFDLVAKNNHKGFALMTRFIDLKNDGDDSTNPSNQQKDKKTEKELSKNFPRAQVVYSETSDIDLDGGVCVRTNTLVNFAIWGNHTMALGLSPLGTDRILRSNTIYMNAVLAFNSAKTRSLAGEGNYVKLSSNARDKDTSSRATHSSVYHTYYDLVNGELSLRVETYPELSPLFVKRAVYHLLYKPLSDDKVTRLPMAKMSNDALAKKNLPFRKSGNDGSSIVFGDYIKPFDKTERIINVNSLDSDGLWRLLGNGMTKVVVTDSGDEDTVPIDITSDDYGYTFRALIGYKNLKIVSKAYESSRNLMQFIEAYVHVMNNIPIPNDNMFNEYDEELRGQTAPHVEFFAVSKF